MYCWVNFKIWKIRVQKWSSLCQQHFSKDHFSWSNYPFSADYLVKHNTLVSLHNFTLHLPINLNISKWVIDNEIMALKARTQKLPILDSMNIYKIPICWSTIHSKMINYSFTMFFHFKGGLLCIQNCAEKQLFKDCRWIVSNYHHT